MKKIACILYVISAVVMAACTATEPTLQTEELDLPATPFVYEASPNNDIATLGRVLFYDRNLSINNSLSCASCHKQSLAFADNVAFSVGFENRVTRRNSMPIQNLREDGGVVGGLPNDSIPIDGDFEGPRTRLFWDGREVNLESMVLKPIANHVEMGISDFTALEKKLSMISHYPELFRRAFGNEEVTSDRIAQSLASFLRNINSTKTKFDRSLRNEDMLTALEQEGRYLFMTVYDCNQCHQIESPHGYEHAGTFANIGLDAEYTDIGRQEVTNLPENNGQFKIPSLRNIALTAPYMHDGRFKTLDAVMGHYSDDIADNSNLDVRLQDPDGSPKRFNISAPDRKAIIAFLNTLTDQEMISDVRFSSPFKAK
jgi:cytochrome c peroxidase